ncbi:MAG TPA: hypothetical protein VM695_09525, partial [Phycisphaerae bacterium]|nr:hypothetical protein [Phycisphaerae bacterium]
AGQRGDGSVICLIDGYVNRGMSGGPVWNLHGEVLGVVVGHSAPQTKVDEQTLSGPSWPGLGVMIPSGYVFEFTKNLLVMGSDEADGEVGGSKQVWNPLTRADDG